MSEGHIRGRIESVKVIQVIEVRHLTGTGTEDDPGREVVEYWSLEGTQLAKHDLILSQETNR